MKIALIIIGLIGYAIAGYSVRSGINITRPSMTVAKQGIQERTKAEPLTEAQWREVDAGLAEAHMLAKVEKYDIGKAEVISFRGLIAISTACLILGIISKKPTK